MATRYFALIFGIIYTIIGLMGLIPAFLQPAVQGNPPVTLDTLHGNLLGIFPVNILHTLVHLIVGVWGILAFRSFDASRGYAIAAGVLFGLLFIMGLVPGLQTVFGLIPLHAADVWLHLVSSAAALFFGLTAPRGAMTGSRV
jgi:hypothetical protein